MKGQATDIPLRDLLAGMAMQGMIGQPDTNMNGVTPRWDATCPSDRATIAESAYLFADAMLRAREMEAAEV